MSWKESLSVIAMWLAIGLVGTATVISMRDCYKADQERIIRLKELDKESKQ